MLRSKIIPSLVFSVGLLFLTSCNSAPKNDIAAVEVGLKSANTAALAYVKLTLCTAAEKPLADKILCSKTDVIVNIGKASASAYLAVTAAEASLSESDLAKAQTAVTALQQIITTAIK